MFASEAPEQRVIAEDQAAFIGAREIPCDHLHNFGGQVGEISNRLLVLVWSRVSGTEARADLS